VIPEYQNPSGRTLSLERRRALIDACRRHGVLIFEDVAYRDLSFDGSALPSLWSLGPDVVLQAGTFSKIFSPGFRMGWALGPASLVAPLADAKQNTDQCAGALGQRMVEEYGRAGHFEAGVARAQALYAAHWAALSASLSAHMPPGVEWSEPTGGMFTWLSVPEGLDVLSLRAAAIRWNVSAKLLAAQLYAESTFNPFAVSRAGAQGIAQFMPETARGIGLDDPFDAERAIDAQAHLMRDLLRQFGSVPLALAAYNAGPTAVAACGCVPNNGESPGYVARILGLMSGAGVPIPLGDGHTLVVRLVR
jgi:DNA-binding transcriptional MocR family regulator